MKYLLVLSLILLTGCSSQSFKDNVKDGVFEQILDKEYSRNAALCPDIKNSCSSGEYVQWTQENGQIACACN